MSGATEEGYMTLLDKGRSIYRSNSETKTLSGLLALSFLCIVRTLLGLLLIIQCFGGLLILSVLGTQLIREPSKFKLVEDRYSFFCLFLSFSQ